MAAGDGAPAKSRGALIAPGIHRQPDRRITGTCLVIGHQGAGQERLSATGCSIFANMTQLHRGVTNTVAAYIRSGIRCR